MFQGIKELSAAKGRTLLITVTVGLIAIMVTFLSALTAGLSHQSVSALQYLAGDKDLVLADSGSTSLSASTLDANTMEQLEQAGAQPLWQVRDRLGDTPVMLLNSSELKPGEISLPAEVDSVQALAQFSSGNSTGGSTGDSTGTAGTVINSANDLYLDHLPVIVLSTSDLAQLAQARGVQGPAAAFIDASSTSSLPAGTIALHSSDRWQASASYQGEQMSLNLMIVMLYIISGLVLGAFFMVWTIQRLRGISIASALGAARRVLIADAIGQALVVLFIGIALGVGFTIALALGLGAALPVVISTATTLYPALILALCGLAGAALSLGPILRVEPRSALMNA